MLVAFFFTINLFIISCYLWEFWSFFNGASFYDDLFGFVFARVPQVYRVSLDLTERMDNRLVNNLI